LKVRTPLDSPRLPAQHGLRRSPGLTTATSPPTPPSQCNIFTRSESQGQGPLHGQLSCATKAGRVEKRIVHHIVGDLINDEDHHVVPGLSQPLVWTRNMQYVSGQDYNASRAAQGIVDCLMGLRIPNRATTSRRETATNPPVLSSQRNVFTRSKSQGQGPSHGQLGHATKAQRVEKRVMHCIVGDSINDEDRYVVPELSQPLIWICNMQCVIG